MSTSDSVLSRDGELPSRLTDLTQAQRSFVFGVLGAALLRNWHAGGPNQSRRLAELIQAVKDVDGKPGSAAIPSEVSVVEGYAEWAHIYDGANALIAAEEPEIRRVLEPFAVPGSLVLDAACGTGRHAAWLTARGCRVVGVDLVNAMLQRAVDRVPNATFVQGDLTSLPLATRSVDLAVCSLALCHVPDLRLALGELARVLRSGGRLVISDPHGRSAYAGGQGFYGWGGITRFRYIRNHHRQASEWIAAFTASSFLVESCYEPAFDTNAARAHPVAAYFPDAVADAFKGLPMLWIWSVVRAP